MDAITDYLGMEMLYFLKGSLGCFGLLYAGILIQEFRSRRDEILDRQGRADRILKYLRTSRNN